MRYLKNLNGNCSGFIFARWHMSLIFKKISCLAGNSKLPPHTLTISDLSSYLEIEMRYLKKLNGICLGVLCTRWHSSLIFKKIFCLAGKFKMAAVQMDHFRFSLISRELDEISKKIKRHLLRFRMCKVTHFFGFQKISCLAGNSKLPPHRLTISDVFSYLKI